MERFDIQHVRCLKSNILHQGNLGRKDKKASKLEELIKETLDVSFKVVDGLEIGASLQEPGAQPQDYSTTFFSFIDIVS